MSVSQTHFQNAHHFEVINGQFMNIANTTIVHENDGVSTYLWPHVAAGVIFDSAARYAAGKCHPGTRKKMIERILTWIDDLDTADRVLWVHGPAGAGKSALAHTICELLRESHPERYGASFFFSSSSTDCGNALKLFTTLSYQLAIHSPPLRAEINDALSHDPSLPTKSMEIQLLSLIIQPILRCQRLLSQSLVLIIDGLDECTDTGGTTQSSIVTLISKLVEEYNPPLRFIIASRPEYWIRDTFESLPISNITLSLSLRDDLDADQDIKAYLTDEFEKIRLENKRVMKSVVPPWPPVNIIDYFVEEASGQYIYASTVLKFVGRSSRFSNPQEQLRIITSPGPHRASAFSELDRLYATILSAYPRQEVMNRVLAGLLVHVNSTIIQVVLDVDPDELVLVLDALSSLISTNHFRQPSVYYAEDDTDMGNERFMSSIFDTHASRDIISFCHRSFEEFLIDQDRSGRFHINLGSHSVPKEIINKFCDMIGHNLDNNYEPERHRVLNLDFATYHGIFLTVTRQSVWHCCLSTLLHMITDMIAKLESFDSSRLVHMDSLFSFLHDLEHLNDILLTVSLSRLEDKNKGHDEGSKEFSAACQKLGEIVQSARQSVSFALPSCIDFEVTPALVFILEYPTRHRQLPLKLLANITGAANLVSTLRRYREILRLTYFFEFNAWFVTVADLFDNDEQPCWRTQGTWRENRVLTACSILKSVESQIDAFNDLGNEHCVLMRFLDSRSISDISNREYFERPYNLAMLSAMIDLAELFHRPHYTADNVILVSIFTWINRQLTNPQTVKLLEDCNKPVLQALTASINNIFKHGFLDPIFASYKKSLCAFVHENPAFGTVARSIRIEVLPLPRGFYEEEMDVDYAKDAHRVFHNDVWKQFHDAAFGNELTSTDASTASNCIIDPSQWYPHLASALLKSLVTFLYGQIFSEFSSFLLYHDWGDPKSGSFPYLIQCLPYAEPTQENLDALRAIVYLFPDLKSPLDPPPDDLWPVVLDLLYKYDRAILSQDELELFVKWLTSTEHLDIKTYCT